jgi:hypothetical protein
MAWLAPESVPDAAAFLTRVLRLDPAAVVRVRGADGHAVSLWSRLPFAVLVSRGVRGAAIEDRTVRADALLASLAGSSLAGSQGGAGGSGTALAGGPGTGASGATGRLPPGRDTDWRWPLPALPGRPVERVPAEEVIRLSRAAAATIRTATVEGVAGRPVGSRMLRDALLDHVPIVVTTDEGERVGVPQRLIQGVVRMDFVPSSGADSVFVQVHVAGPWVGLVAPYGTAWYRPPLLLR